MPQITGRVYDIGLSGSKGKMWLSAGFRTGTDGVVAPRRVSYPIVDGELPDNVIVEPGPAYLEIDVGMDAHNGWPVNIPETDVSLKDLISEVYDWSPTELSLFAQMRIAAEDAAQEAETLAGEAGTAKGAAEDAAAAAALDRVHVDSIRALLDEAAQTNVAPYLTDAALKATYVPAVAKDVNPVTGCHHVNGWGAVGDGETDDTAAIQAAIDETATSPYPLSGMGRTYRVRSIQWGHSNRTYRDFRLETIDGTENFRAPVTIGALSDGTKRTNIRFTRVHVDGRREGQTGTFVPQENGGRHAWRILGWLDGLHLEDCSGINSAGDGLCVYSGMAPDMEDGVAVKVNLNFTRCVFTGNRRHGGSFDSVDKVRSVGSAWTGNGLDMGTSAGDQYNGSNYGNGIDIEEYVNSTWDGECSFVGDDFRGNAGSSVLVYLQEAVNQALAGFVKRGPFRFDRCQLDKGLAGITNAALTVTPISSRRGTGSAFSAVTVTDCTINGDVLVSDADTFTWAGGAKGPGAQVAAYPGQVHHVTTALIDVPGVSLPPFMSGPVGLSQPSSVDSSRMLPSSLFASRTGAPEARTSPLPGWGLRDGAVSDGVRTVFAVPSHWRAFRAEVMWTSVAVVGSVKFGVEVRHLAQGGTTNPVSTLATIVSPVVTTSQFNNFSAAAPAITCTPNATVTIVVARYADDAADTMTDTATFHALKLTRTA